MEAGKRLHNTKSVAPYPPAALPEGGDQAAYFFHEGTNFHAYEYLGVTKENGGYRFRVWAPGAKEVFLVGDRFRWDTGIPMEKHEDAGVFVCFYPTADSLEGKNINSRSFPPVGSVISLIPTPFPRKPWRKPPPVFTVTGTIPGRMMRG